MNKKKFKGKIWALVIIIIGIVLYAYIYVIPKVSDIFVDTYSAEYGTLESGVDTTCLLVRNEDVYKASNTGQVDRVIGQGRLMRRGSRIVTVGGTGYYSEKRGVISYYYDGLESFFTLDNADKITISDLEKVNSKDFKINKCKTGEAKSGDYLFKVVDNLEWNIVSWLSEEEAESFQEGNAVTVAFSDGATVKMKIKNIQDQNGYKRILITGNRYYEFFDKYRMQKCRLISSKRSGILLEADSIVESDGQKGVYVRDKHGNSNFTPVKILAQKGEVVVVENNYYFDSEGKRINTVKNYDEILRNIEKIQKKRGSGANVD